MLIKLGLWAATAATLLGAWRQWRRQHHSRVQRVRAQERVALQRWEDEGGNLPPAPATTRPSSNPSSPRPRRRAVA